MRCYIYKSIKQQDLYLYVLREDDFTEVPESLLQNMGAPELVMPLELTSQRKLARADVAHVIEKLNSQGFYLQMPPTKMPSPERLQ